MVMFITKRRSKKNGKLYTAIVAQQVCDDNTTKEVYVTFDRLAISKIARLCGVNLSSLKEGEELIIV